MPPLLPNPENRGSDPQRPGRVASVTAKTEKKRPELLYDLTNLQKEANKRFGFTAEHTLAVAQELYEAKLISYPRTNSRCLTEADAVNVLTAASSQ